MKYDLMPPYLPTTFREDFHHGGNSVCFAIQAAHLMGANPIYLVGFTLQTGLGYFHGRTNPVTRRTTIYQTERALAWLDWYGKKFPGRVLLDPSFDGPIYSVFKKATFNARQTTARNELADSGGHQSDADSARRGEVPGPRQDREAAPASDQGGLSNG
jgi:hypothetical protein